MGDLTPVCYAPVRKDTAFQHVLATPLSFDGALEVVRAMLAERDLWIIHEIDPQMLLARSGYRIERTRQILFFHPRYMVRLLGADPSALLEAPLKIVVLESAGAVTLRWSLPETLFEKYENEQLTRLSRELAAVYAAIAAELERRAAAH
ncbi:DUF302 domain-containing protein [Bradyrhizobium manausense]